MISNIVYINRNEERFSIKGNTYDSIYGEKGTNEYQQNIQKFGWKTINVEWQYNDKIVTVSCEKDKSINAYLTPDGNYMMVTYYKDSKFFPRPNNCVMYNPDGTIFRVIQYPKLISKEASMSKKKHLFYLFMDGFKWVKNIKGGFDVAIILCFGDSWYETRIYDYINDEFKECIEEGRY